MRKFFTKTSKLNFSTAIMCAVFFSANGFSQTTVLPVTTDTICNGDTVKLGASSSKGAMVTFAWSDTSGAMSISPATGDTVSVYPSKTTNYRVVGDSAGTKDTSYFTVTVNALPTVVGTASNNSICAGDSVAVTGSGAKTYVWDNAAIDGMKMQVLMSTVFNVVGTDSNGCKNSDTANVMVKASPTITAATNDSVLCKNDSTMLWASGGMGYIWSSNQGMTPVIADTIKVSPTMSATYYVLGTGNNTCKGLDSLKIMVAGNPTVKVMLSDTMPCFNDTLWLYASGAKTYIWGSTFPNAPTGTGDTVFDVPVNPRNYWVTGVDSNGCSGMDTAEIAIRSLPKEKIQGFVNGVSLGTGLKVCTDEILTVKANNGGNTYSWGPSNIVSDTVGSQTTLMVAKVVTVTTKIDSSNGCSSIVHTTYSPSTFKPVMNVTWVTDSTICAGDTANAIIGGATSYTWTPTSTVADPNSRDAKFFPNVTTIYTVKGLSDGCTAEKTVKVLVNPIPDISLSQSSGGSALCADEPDTITISSNSGVLFDWGYGVISGAKIKSVLPGKTTLLTIAAISSKGCRKSAQITIVVDTTCGVRVGFEKLEAKNEINTYLVSSTGELHIDFGSVSSGNVNVELINLTGATAKSFNLGEITTDEKRVLNVSDLPSGMYLLRVRSRNYDIVNKIMR